MKHSDKSDSRAEAIATYQLCATYSQRYQDILLRIPMDVFKDDLQHVTRERRDSIAGALHAYIDLCAEQEFLHREGIIPDSVWENWLAGMQNMFQIRLLGEVWGSCRGAERYKALLAVLEL